MGERPASSSGSENGCASLAVVIGIIVGAVLLLQRCGASDTSSNAPPAAVSNAIDASLTAAIAPQAPPTVAPLWPKSARKGVAELTLAVDAEGLSGAMIYSENCYDALSHTFSWSKLDTCGAFDQAAVHAADTTDLTELSKEAGYFQSEVAAGRYLAAATAAGADAGAADQRLAALQAKVPTPEPKATPTPSATPAEEPAIGPGEMMVTPEGLPLDGGTQ